MTHYPRCDFIEPCGARTREGKCRILNNTDFGSRPCPFRKPDLKSPKEFVLIMRGEGYTQEEIMEELKINNKQLQHINKTLLREGALDDEKKTVRVKRRIKHG